MALPESDDPADDKPLDPAVEKVRRKLVRFIVINLGLLFVALMAVVGAIVYKTVSAPSEVAARPMTEIPLPADGMLIEGAIALPKDAVLASQSLSGNRLSLDVTLADGSRVIFLYDLAEKRMIGRFALTVQ